MSFIYFQNRRLTSVLILFLFYLILGLATVSCNAETQNNSVETFSVFWKEFRIASLNNDIDRVVEMTRFPFIVKGDLDMDGSVVLNKNEFKKQFKSFLEQDIRENLTGESMRDYLNKNKLISPRIDEGQTSVGLFSFELIRGKWYFILVYSDS